MIATPVAEEEDSTVATDALPLGSASVSLWDGMAAAPEGAPVAELPRPGAATELVGGVDPAVHAALAESEDGTVEVIVEVAGGLDPAELAQRADRAALAAGAQARADGIAPNAPEAAAAADLARGELVVAALQEAGATERGAVAELIATGEAARAAQSAQDAEVVRELWVVNAVAGPVDAGTLAEVAARPDVVAIRLDTTIEVPDLAGGPLLPEWGLEKVAAPQTWGEYGYRGQGVTVAVLDTGIDVNHPALAGQYRGRDGDHSDSWFVSTGENYPTPGDGHGHGTHVTGSITGGPPGEVIGVAPRAEYIGVKILSDGGSGSTSGILAGMQWVLAPGGDPARAPDVANNSWGNAAGADTSFWAAVEAWRAAGIVPVFANGNTGPMPGTVGSPADYPHSFGVGATDRDDAVAGFSSRGPVFWDGVEYTKPQVSAPGHEIRSAWPTASGMDYRTISGTSMATPHVSGVAALVLSANPALSVDEVEDVLEQTARAETTMGPLPNNAYGHGIVDAFAATTRAAHSGLVTGAVTGPDGPVAAQLSILDSPAATTTDPATGGYELWVPTGVHTLRVEAYGYVAHETEIEVATGAVLTLDIELQAEQFATVSGTVSDPDGPVAGAEVRVVGQPGVATSTDAAGAYAIELPHGTHTLRVLATGYLPWVGSIEVSGPLEHDVVLSVLPGGSQRGWPELSANPASTGLAASGLDGPSLSELWTAKVPSVTFASPVVSEDSVYIASVAGTLTALDRADGSVRWTAATGSGQRGTPVVHGDQVLVTTGNSATLLSLGAADGSVGWSYSLGSDLPTYGAPTVVDGVVLLAVGNADTGGVHAVDLESGSQLWRTDVGAGVFFGPSVADGVVVAASTGSRQVVAMDLATGEVLWTHTDTEASLSLPAIADGTVYIGTSTPDYTGGSLLALDLTTGAEVWRAGGHGDTQGSSPVVYGDLVVLGSHSHGSVAAYDRGSGERVWHHYVGTAVTSSTAATSSGLILGGAQDRSIWALDATSGERLWTGQMPAAILSSTAVADGMAVFVSSDGTVAAYTSRGLVSGTVTGPDGPVAATVELVGTDISTTADPDTGEFELEPPVGDYTLRISSYGLSTHTEQIRVTPALPVVVHATLTAVSTGAVAGVVTDAFGEPVAGVTVRLLGTPVEPATTDEDGAYGLPEVAEGSYLLEASLPGYESQTDEIVVTADQTTVHDLTLHRYDVAVVADYQGGIAGVLRGQGLRVDEVSFAEIEGNADRYAALVLNGSGTDRADADLERLAAIVTQAEEAGVSIVALDQWALSYGSVGPLLTATGRAGSVGTENANRGPVWLTDPQPHQVTASIGEGRHQLLTGGNHGWLVGYEGASLATLGSDRDGPRGSGIGYERVGYDNALVLLPTMAASAWAGPGRTWTPAAPALLADAVEHALTAQFGAVVLTVTADGAPVDGVLSVVGSFEREPVTDGTGRMLLDPGSHTIRVQSLGLTTAEVEVEVVAGQDTEVELALEPADTGAIAGTVLDASSGTPVAGATVTVVDSGLDPVTTGSSGTFTVADVPTGTHSIEVVAEGYGPGLADDIEVTTGATTQVEVELDRTPRVVVVGDYINRLTTLLNEHGIPTVATGWEVTADLSEVDVAIVNHPANVTPGVFAQHLAAFDEAGVSVIWPGGNTASSSRGIHLLSDHTGNPEAIVPQGGLNQPPIDLSGFVDHPILRGVGPDPVTLLNGGGEAPWFEGPKGYVLAQVGIEGTVGGPGIAYDVRTADSVHVLLSGLGSTLRNNPTTVWTEDGTQVFLNTVRWAAAPRLAQVTGTVTDPGGAAITHATVTVEDHGWSAEADDQGQWRLGLPDGDFTLTIAAHGYASEQREVTITGGAGVELDVTLQVGAAAELSGTITSVTGTGTGIDGAGVDGAGGDVSADGEPIPDALVRLSGTSLSTVTDEQGRYSFPLVDAGEQELEVEAPGHVRTLHTFEMPEAAHVEDVAILVAPSVGVIADSPSGATAGRTAAFLQDWGYDPVAVGWGDLETIAGLDLVVVNVAGPGQDPGAAGLTAFQDAVNRAGIPVVWLGNYDRGAIRYLTSHQGDPQVWGQGTLSGAVTTTVTADHALTEGLPESFEGTEPGRFFGYFSGFSGTTVATIASETGDHSGDAVAYRGRTTETVDILLSAVNNSSYGALGTRTEPALYLSQESARLLVNALQWGVVAEGIGADARGSVVDSGGTPVAATVTVEETGRTHPARAGDGSFVVPLEPGTWTLTASAFGYTDASVQVTVEAGEGVQTQIVLPTAPGAAISGRVTDASGAGVSGAEVVVHDTALTATTNASGDYQIAHVPEGEWLLSATAGEGRTRFADVTVVDQVPVSQSFRLGAPAHVAVLGDRATDGIAPFLTGHGFTAQTYAYNALDQVDLAEGGYDLVVLNGGGAAPSQEAFLAFVDAAAEHDLPLVFASQFGSGSIRHLSSYAGDPESVAQGFRPGQMGYVVREAHPIFEGFDIGDTVTLLDNGTLNQQFGVFHGYSGTLLADTVHPSTEEVIGGGLAYRFATPSSVHLLLGNLNAGAYGSPEGRWTIDGTRVYLNALDWALLARQSQIQGTVTGQGEPVAGAEVAVEGTALSTTTGADGSYALGVGPGEHTVQVTAAGYLPSTHQVSVGEEETVQLDVELVPLPATSLTVQVRDAAHAGPVAGAEVSADGPSQVTGSTDEAGVVLLEPVLVGDYQVQVSAPGYLPASAAVTVGDEPAQLLVELERIGVGVLGDVNGDLTDWLVSAEVPAEETDWASASVDPTAYEVIVVNGGTPSAEQFTGLLETADEAGVSLVFTGTYGVDQGGIRLLEAHGDGVSVGGHGYGDGPVGVTDFDAEHPLFDGVTDAAHIIADDGYYSWLSEQPGEELAVLTVAGEALGTAVAHEPRTAVSGHLLLSFAAVTDYMGPGRGWTEDTGQLLLNGLEWLQEESELAVPTLEVPAELVAESPVTVTGTAVGAQTVQVLVDGEVAAQTEVGPDAGYTVAVELGEGPNVLVARALSGEASAESAPVTVVLDTTAPELTVEGLDDGTAYLEPVVTVTGTVTDEFAGVESLTIAGETVEVAADGTFEAQVELDEGVNLVAVVATDTLGNEVSEEREVLFAPLSAHWVTPQDVRGNELRLQLLDPGGASVQVDHVVAVLTVDGSEPFELPMAYVGGVYRVALHGSREPVSYTAQAVLTIEGYVAHVEGPAFTVP